MIIKNSILTLLMLLATCTMQVNAQTKTVDFDKGNNLPTKKNNRNSKYTSGNNGISLGILSIVQGYLTVNYEVALLNRLTVEGGAGVTFRSVTNDLSEAAHNDGEHSVFFEHTPLYHDVPDAYDEYSNRQSRLGLCFTLATKYYTKHDALDGVFIGPNFAYKQFNYTAKMADETKYTSMLTDDVDRVETRQNEYMKCKDLTLCIGRAWQFRNNVLAMVSFGAGIRNYSASRLDIAVYDNPQTASKHYVNRENVYSMQRTLFTVDVRIGGWF